MLIAGEVETKSKWAISPELYFQTAPVAQTSTSWKHILPFDFLQGKLHSEEKYVNIKKIILSQIYLKTRMFLKSPI